MLVVSKGRRDVVIVFGIKSVFVWNEFFIRLLMGWLGCLFRLGWFVGGYVVCFLLIL